MVWLQSCPCSCGRTIRNPSPMFLKETPIHTLVHQLRLEWDCVFGLSLGPPSGQVDLCSCLFRKSHVTTSVPELVSVYLMSPRRAEPLKDSFHLLSWFPPYVRSQYRLELTSPQQCVPSIVVLERLNRRGLPQQRCHIRATLHARLLRRRHSETGGNAGSVLMPGFCHLSSFSKSRE